MATAKNPRKQTLDAICTKIAMFMMMKTFTSEKGVHKHLIDAVHSLKKAEKLIVAHDRKKEKNEQTTT